jgi:L-fuculokinase
VPTYCIAVFDVGKTNKKLLVFDEKLDLLDSSYAVFSEIEREGVHYEDMEGIESWFKAQLYSFAKKYPIRAISVTTHGAAYASVDAQGNLAIPVTSYTTEVDDSFNREFYDAFGDSRELQRITATPRFDALLNVAKAIFFAKKMFPGDYAKIASILNYPQYYGYRLTGNVGAEWTYVGCHTYLWDFQKWKWSSVAEGLGILDRLPREIKKPWDILGTISPSVAEETGVSGDTTVTLGIHDSNASLLPYLIKVKEDFVLNSTGTWCVLMHPMKRVVWGRGDLGNVVFYNLDAFSHPVKTTIFTGGMEFDVYTELFKRIARSETDTHFEQSLFQRIIRERRLFILPEVFKGSGQFSGSVARVVEDDRVYPLSAIQSGEVTPAFFRETKTATAVLGLSLLIQTKVAMERAGFTPGMSLFIEGGFRQNEAYSSLVSALYPTSPISHTGMKEATAFGAAILGKIAVEKLDPNEVGSFFEIEFSPVESQRLEGLDGYIEAFLERI